ncbi:MAG TPA: methyltransferase [Candidatus Lumbricidophila sp.]|nr:methyltransferase [Candidatus Lumbricidophila sp.]
MTPEFVALVAQLRHDLTSADYTEATVGRLLALGAGRIDASAALKRGHVTPALRALHARSSAAAVLFRLFRLGDTVSSDELAGALRRLGTAGAEALGLVQHGASGWRATLDISPHAATDSVGSVDWWIVSDLGELATGAPVAEDHVLGVGGASISLSRQLLARASRRTLDLGCGSGVQALHASRYSDFVVATDISDRALWLAEFTCALNEVTNVEFRYGSLYEPVAGERFDAIASNPPFVITPRDHDVPGYEYRDGGLVGDGVTKAVIRGAQAHLTVGGVAQMLGNWEYRTSPAAEGDPGQLGDGLARVAAWLDDCPELDAWVIERERQDPSEYAETWIRDGGLRPGTSAFNSLHAAWLDDFERRGVEAVGFGYVLLRRRQPGAPALRRFETASGVLGEEGLAAHFAGVLDAVDSLVAAGALAGSGGPGPDAVPDQDFALRGVYVERAEDVTEERHHWPGDEQPTVLLLRQGGGFGRAISASPALSGLVGAADGELPVGVLNDAIAQLLEVDASELWAELAPEIRELVWCGMLRPIAGQ